MPGRTTPLVNDYFYHIYNRGSDKRNIFTQPRDYKRFLQTFYYYQFEGPRPRFSIFTKSNLNFSKPLSTEKLVDIVCYCLMPNHFHFLLKQRQENGIAIFMSLLSNSYTKYFNIKYRRIGALLQGVFKSVLVETDEQLIHVSRYIHLNPIVSSLERTLERYPWSSYDEYMRKTTSICVKENVLTHFSPVQPYKQFVEDQIEYGRSLELIKHQLIDEDE